jgi:hypothetical protein
MRIVLSIEAIAPPLTGIGRYTWELQKNWGQVFVMAIKGFFSNFNMVSVIF